MKENKGFSLIEIVVVIAIMAILVGLSVLSIRLLFGVDAKECAKKIQANLSNTKTGALSKGGQDLKLYQDATSGDYLVEFIEYQYEGNATTPTECTTGSETVGSSKVEIICYFETGVDPVTIDATHTVTCGFDRSSGAFKKVRVNGVEKNTYCNKIVIRRASKEYSIIMIPETGKFYIG